MLSVCISVAGQARPGQGCYNHHHKSGSSGLSSPSPSPSVCAGEVVTAHKIMNQLCGFTNWNLLRSDHVLQVLWALARQGTFLRTIPVIPGLPPAVRSGGNSQLRATKYSDCQAWWARLGQAGHVVELSVLTEIRNYFISATCGRLVKRSSFFFWKILKQTPDGDNNGAQHG